MQPSPDPAVVDWEDRQTGAETHTTSITVAEILFGIELLPVGNRRERIASQAGAMLDEEFSQRILVFDADAAFHYAQLAALRRHTRKPISLTDAQIAVICIAHGAELDTRDAGGFAGP